MMAVPCWWCAKGGYDREIYTTGIQWLDRYGSSTGRYTTTTPDKIGSASLALTRWLKANSSTGSEPPVFGPQALRPSSNSSLALMLHIQKEEAG